MKKLSLLLLVVLCSIRSLAAPLPIYYYISGDFTVPGNWNTDYKGAGSAATSFSSAGAVWIVNQALNINTAWTIGGTLQIGDGTSTNTVTISVAPGIGSCTVLNNAILTLTANPTGGSITVSNGGKLNVNGSCSATSPAMAVTQGATSTIVYGGGTQVLPAIAYGNLTIANNVSLGGAITVNGNLLLSSGILDVSASNYGIALKGDWTNNAGTTAFNGEGGTVTTTGSSTYQNFDNGSFPTTFKNVTFNNPNNQYLSLDGTTFGGNVIMNGPVFADDITLYVQGDWTDNNDQFTAHNSTVVFNGTAVQHIYSTEGEQFTVLVNNNTAGLWATDNTTTTDVLTLAAGSTLNTGSVGIEVYANIYGTGTQTGTGAVRMEEPGSISGVTLDLLTLTGADGGGYSLSGDLTINSKLSIAGAADGLQIGSHTLTINGQLDVMSPGITFTGSSTSNLVINSAQTNAVYMNVSNASTQTLGTLTIKSGASVALGSNVNIGTTLILNGSLDDGGHTINNAGNIAGIGTYTGTGVMNLVGSSIQSISGASLQNITFNNAAGFSLTGSPTINGTLTFTTGVLDISSTNLIFGTTAAIGGTPSVSSMVYASSIGVMQKLYSGTGSFTYPIGNGGIPVYSPITLNFTGGTFDAGAYVGVTVTNGDEQANGSITDYLNRYWSVATSGITNPAYVVTGATYDAGDVVGAESNILLAAYEGPGLTALSGSTVNTTTHTLAATGTVTVTATDITGITGMSATPPVAVSTDNTTICSGQSTSLSAAGSTGTAPLTYSWAPAAGLSATTGIAVTATPTVTTTYTLTVTDGSSLTGQATTMVSVNAIPVIGVSGGATVCLGTSAPLTATGGTTYSWLPATGLNVTTGGSVTGTPTVTTTYTVTGTTSGCSAKATVTVTINTTPSGTITGPSTVTAGSGSIALTDAVSDGTWGVSNGNATVDGSGNVTGVTPGTVTVIYSVTGTCGPATATKLITVNGSSVSGINGNATVCLGTTTIYTDATTGGNWSSSNISVATVGGTTGVVAGIYTGTATIYYTAGGVSTSAIVTVIASPANITGAATVCVSTNVTISDGVAAGSWTSSNSNVTLTPTGSTLSIYGATAGTTTLTYSLADACYRTYVVTVNPLPAAIAAGAGQLCVGGTLMVSDATGGAIGYGSSMPSVASVINSGKVTGVAAGTTTITYQISTGCMTTTIVTVNTAPGAINGNAPVCAGTGITLTDNVSDGVWSSSNTAAGTIDPSAGAFTGIAGGSTIISYSAGGCAVGTTVTVKPIQPIAGLSAVSVGATITLSDATASGTWSSSSPAGSVSTTGVVTGISNGTTTIIYTYAGCTRSQVVTVNPALGAIGGSTTLCQNTTATLTPPTGASGGTWSSSNSVNVSIGSASGIATAGPYTGTVTITYTQAPGSYSTFVVTLNPLPATIVGPASPRTCPGGSFTISDATTGGLWSSSNPLIGSVSTTGGVGTVTGESAGLITLTYTLPSTCARVYGPVTVNPLPAAINTGIGTLCPGGTLALSDASGPSNGYSSSNTSLATVTGTGAVTGVGAGVVNITYTINTGCYITAPVTVNPAPVVAAISGPSTISHAAPATLSDATPGGTWSTSNIHAYTLSGIATQTVTATALVSSGGANIYYSLSNGFGCTTTMAKNVVATARYAQGGNTTVYTGATVVIADEVLTGVWASSDNTIATVDANGAVTGIRPGTTNITHDITDNEGNMTTITTAVVVNALPASISMIPNPNKGTFTVKGTLGSVSDEEVSLEVTDVLGQVIYKSKVQSHGGTINETITLGGSLANGMYMLNVVSSTEKITFHFVMER